MSKLLRLFVLLVIPCLAGEYTASLLSWNDGAEAITSVIVVGPLDGPQFVPVRLEYVCGRRTCSADGQAFEVTPGKWLAEFQGIKAPLRAAVFMPSESR